MTDYHVHIGQFDKVYYYADRVFSALKASGVDEVYFSSTTSCLYCPPKDLYEGVRGEISDALKAAEEVGIKAHALYWVVPDVYFSGISIKQAMSEMAYDGFKIHPRAQKWDLTDNKTITLVKEIFSYAQNYEKLILIHCDDDNSPKLFELFIAQYPKALVQIAHCRPFSDTVDMLRNYSNVVADTAMVNEDVIAKLKGLGFSEQLRFGSDFPITHWREEKPVSDPSQEELMAFL